MAVVLGKTGVLTAMETVPIPLAPAGNAGGNLKVAAGTVELANGDSIASIYKLCRLPSNCYVRRVLLYCDAITTCAASFGLYYSTPTKLGGPIIQSGAYAGGLVVVSVALFATGQTLAGALTVGTDITFSTTPTNIDKMETPLWQLAGLTADPFVDFDICATLTAAAASAGTVSMQAFFSDNR